MASRPQEPPSHSRRRRRRWLLLWVLPVTLPLQCTVSYSRTSMPSAFDILGLVLGIVSISEFLKFAWRLFAARLPSGREHNIQDALEKTRMQLHRLERDGHLDHGGRDERRDLDL